MMSQKGIMAIVNFLKSLLREHCPAPIRNIPWGFFIFFFKLHTADGMWGSGFTSFQWAGPGG